MKIFTILLVTLLAVSFVYADNIQFRANMSVQVSRGAFDPAVDKVFVRASFNGWGNNPYDLDTLFDGDHDLIYTKTISLTAGDSTLFKFAFRDVSASGDVWESINNRSYTVPSGGGTFTDFFNKDSTLPAPDYWQPTGTLPAMRAYAITVGKYDTTEIVFVGTDTGVYRSSNLGATWTQAGLANIRVAALATDSSGNVFAGTGNAGVYISTDKGNNWFQTALTGVGVNALIINPSGYIFAGTEGQGLYQSTLKDIDSMHQWTRIDTGWTNSSVYALTFDEYGRVYAGTNGGGVYFIIPSGDDSLLWTSRQMNTGLTNLNVLALASNSTGTMFAGTNGGGLYRSTNHGMVWSHLTVPGSPTVIRCMGVRDNDDLFIGTDSGRTYQDTSNGDSWTQLTPMFSSIVQSFAFTTNGYAFGATANNGVYKSVLLSTVQYLKICASVYLNYGGTISSPGVTTVSAGTNITYFINPLPGYHIYQVYVGDAQANPCNNYSQILQPGVINSYTFYNVQVNKHIGVEFVQDPVVPAFWWLGTLRNDYLGFSDAWDVTNDGIVVGGSYTQSGLYHAFYWTQAGSGTMTDIGTLSGGTYSLARRIYTTTTGLQYYGIPKAIYVVGTSRNLLGKYHAFVSDLTFATKNYDLGTLGGNNSDAWGIDGGNSDVTIVGASSDGQYNKAAEWRFDPVWGGNLLNITNGQMLGGNNSCEYNYYYQSVHFCGAVGRSQTSGAPNGIYHAYESGVSLSGYLNDLGTLSPGGTSSAYGWGGDGIVGYSSYSGGYTAFWKGGYPATMVSLGNLSNTNFGGSNAYDGGFDDYNNQNFVVGTSTNSYGPNTAALWTWFTNPPDPSVDLTVTDLTATYQSIVNNPGDPSWLQIARAASDNGQYIVGRGFHKINGHWRLEAFLMKRW